MALKLSLISDVRDFLKGIDRVSDAMEDVADSLDNVGKDSQRVEDKVGDSFKDMADSAVKDTRRLEDKVSDAFKGMAADADKAGKDIGDATKRGTDKAGDGLRDMKDESASTAKEAAASFSSIEDSADALQEVLANAFTGFGPAGAAAGIAAAVGIGLAISAMQDTADKTNEAKQEAIDLATTWRENGGAFTMQTAIEAMETYGDTIVDTKEWWEIFQEQAVSGWEQIRDRAKAGGVSLKDAFRGAFGPAEDAVKVQAELASRIDAVTEAETRSSGMKDELGQAYTYVTDAGQAQLDGLRGLKDQIDQNVKRQQDAAEIERIRKEAIAGTTEAIRENIDALEEQADLIKGSAASQLDYLDSVDDLAAKLKESKNAWDINTAAGRENRRAVLDTASSIEDMARAQLDAGTPVATVTANFQKQRDALVNQVLPAFKGNKDAAEKYIASILRIPQGANTKVTANTAQAERDINHTARDRNTTVNLYPNGQYIDHFIQTQQGRRIFVDVVPKGGVGVTN